MSDKIQVQTCPSCGGHAWRTGNINKYTYANEYYQCCDPNCGAVWVFWDSVDEFYKIFDFNRGVCG